MPPFTVKMPKCYCAGPSGQLPELGRRFCRVTRRQQRAAESRRTVYTLCRRLHPTFFSARRPDGPAGCATDFSECEHVRLFFFLPQQRGPCQSDQTARLHHEDAVPVMGLFFFFFAPPRSKTKGSMSVPGNKGFAEERGTEAGKATAAAQLICLPQELGPAFVPPPPIAEGEEGTG